MCEWVKLGFLWEVLSVISYTNPVGSDLCNSSRNSSGNLMLNCGYQSLYFPFPSLPFSPFLSYFLSLLLFPLPFSCFLLRCSVLLGISPQWPLEIYIHFSVLPNALSLFVSKNRLEKGVPMNYFLRFWNSTINLMLIKYW